MTQVDSISAGFMPKLLVNVDRLENYMVNHGVDVFDFKTGLMVDRVTLKPCNVTAPSTSSEMNKTPEKNTGLDPSPIACEISPKKYDDEANFASLENGPVIDTETTLIPQITSHESNQKLSLIGPNSNNTIIHDSTQIPDLKSQSEEMVLLL